MTKEFCRRNDVRLSVTNKLGNMGKQQTVGIYSQGRRNENKTNVRYSLIGQRPGMEPGSHCLNQVASLLISANKPKQSCKCNGQDSRHRSRVKKNSMEGARFQARSGPGKLHVLERRLVSNCRLSAIFSHRKTCFFANTII